ncbi:tryptophan 7-halogenase [Glaciecola sp. MH2013]|uniref:tryptophan halogenase family protein n=1 Tax=Glaciecola sp. MH2013 TaxID=2785524 RepID=UPI00189CFBBA|nr:tryptophan halogenase family protein [Glaciecola sp. MH2013]MBF7072316.1 tryptophan 7-halogenase [Glaciecola sp. MH2013]
MHLCIVGGGSAGWMTAAGLAKKFENTALTITLVESEEIGTVGVGEATLPHIRFFNQTLGIDERDFMRKTKATFKLGIEFVNWGRKGQRYIHPFGDFGPPIQSIDFYQHWLHAQQQNQDVGALSDYAYGIVAAQNNKFAMPKGDSSDITNAFGYAYQFDSILYAKYLREFAEERGVNRVEGKIVNTSLCEQSGNIHTLSLESGQCISADFFIDCSGFRGLLIEQALHSGYQDWSRWLPANSAVAVPCESAGELGPYTRATAQDSGWIWRIPLQHRTGNGYVYCNDFISDDNAKDTLMGQLDGKALSSPRQLRFKTGRRNQFWKNNVVAIGLSAGFLEPLESTSIDLIQSGITKLIELFPELEDASKTTVAGEPSAYKLNHFDMDEYNAQMSLEYERIRDFLLLHYVANEKDDSPMWQYYREMELPQSLEDKLDAWLHRGYIQRYEIGAFLPPSWVAVMLGQNLTPKNVDPRVQNTEAKYSLEVARNMRKRIHEGSQQAQSHAKFLEHYLGLNTLGNTQ